MINFFLLTSSITLIKIVNQQKYFCNIHYTVFKLENNHEVTE